MIPTPRNRGSLPAHPGALLLLGLLSLLPRPGAAAGPTGDPASGGEALGTLHGAIDAEVRRARRAVPEIGVMVTELGSGETVYRHRADEPFVAASNTKLVTTAAAVDLLGPGWFFETPLLLRGAVSAEGVLQGDLAVVGGGDPLVSGRWTGDPFLVFRRFAEALLARGVRRIGGDLYLASGRFGEPAVHPGWPEDDLARCFEAPVTALAFESNCALLTVQPALRGRPGIDQRPFEGAVEVVNRVRPVSGRPGSRVRVLRRPDDPRVEVTGAVSRGSSNVEVWVSVPDPPRYFGAALARTLRGEGIAFEGRVRPVGELPAGVWERVAVHRSDLLTAVEVANRQSQNLSAELLLRTLGEELCGDGSFEGGVRAAAELLDRIGIPPGSYSMADGSGLARANRFAPAHLVRLLEHMAAHRWAEPYFESLAVSGADDGTLEERLAGEGYRGRVHAKTGTLSDVAALSGYADARSGRRYAFSILATGTAVWRARDAQDAIVRAIIDHG